MRIEITKDYVGSKIYAIPTGNNASRVKERQDTVEFEVIGKTRKDRIEHIKSIFENYNDHN